jgi:hypothetical protein
MTQFAADGRGVVGSKSSLSVPMALRLAWVSWVIMLVLPFLVFLAMIWQTAIMTHGPAVGGETWFLAASFYLLLAVPSSFFWRGHVFKAYWTGHTVSPGKYLFGMLSIWLTLEIGGLFSLIGCFVNNSALPCLLPALVAFMFFVTMWPSGRAMVRTVGNHEDAAVYEEPR